MFTPRLEEEFHLRLERERQEREKAEAEALRRAARLEERRKGIELAREAAETAVMIAEDARSAIAVRLKTPLQLAFVSRQASGLGGTLHVAFGRVSRRPGHRFTDTYFVLLSFVLLDSQFSSDTVLYI